MICVVVGTSPSPDVNYQLSISTSRRYSDALTLGIRFFPTPNYLSCLTMLLSVGDASNTEIEPNLDMDIDYPNKMGVVDTAQAPKDHMDTRSVPQIEQERSFSSNLSPAIWSILSTRAAVRDRGTTSLLQACNCFLSFPHIFVNASLVRRRDFPDVWHLSHIIRKSMETRIIHAVC